MHEASYWWSIFIRSENSDNRARIFSMVVIDNFVQIYLLKAQIAWKVTTWTAPIFSINFSNVSKFLRFFLRFEDEKPKNVKLVEFIWITFIEFLSYIYNFNWILIIISNRRMQFWRPAGQTLIFKNLGVWQLSKRKIKFWNI